MEEINIMEWNINQRSGYGNSNHQNEHSIPDLVCNEIMGRSADIVVLTEFYKSKNWNEFISNTFPKHNVFYTANPMNQNDVLIAVKSELKVTHAEFLISAYENDSPNCLRVDIEFNGDDICLLGVRIRVGDGKKEDYKQRKRQFDSMLKMVDTAKKVLILGDFNNARILLLENKSYSDEEIAKAYSGKDHAPYNYNIIANEFKKHKIEISTPSSGSSWGGYIKNDHIAFTDGVQVVACKYDWNFVKNSDVYQGIKSDGTGLWEEWKKRTKSVSYPDHAILEATIQI